MDILYTDKVSGFCIVSSDSDFTRLAIRLREAGMKVYGFGEKKTPKPFITACDRFIYIEILKPEEEPKTESSSAKPKNKTKQPQTPLKKVDPKTITLIKESVADIADDSGWAYLGALGGLLSRKKTDFDPRNYGFEKLLPLIKSLNMFEIDEKESGVNNIKHIYLKLK